MIPTIKRIAGVLVVDRIAGVIKDQKLAAGSRLPGEHELVEQLQVTMLHQMGIETDSFGSSAGTLNELKV